MTRARAARTLAAVLERRALAAVTLASLLGLFAQLLFFHEPLGLNALLVTALFLAAAWTQRDPAAPVRARDAWLPASALAFATFCMVRADAPLLAFDVLATIGLAAATVSAWSGVPVSALPVARVLAEGLVARRARDARRGRGGHPRVAAAARRAQALRPGLGLRRGHRPGGALRRRLRAALLVRRRRVRAVARERLRSEADRRCARRGARPSVDRARVRVASGRRDGRALAGAA